MRFIKSIIDFLFYKIKVNIQPENEQVLNLLKQYSYQGRTEQNDHINSIFTIFFESFYSPPEYVSVYKFIFNNILLYFVDGKTMTSESQNSRLNMIFITNSNCNLNFEITNEPANINNPDCTKIIYKDGKVKMYIDDERYYLEYLTYFEAIKHYLNNYGQNNFPISFASYPNKKVLLFSANQGINGDIISKEELDNVCSVLINLNMNLK